MNSSPSPSPRKRVGIWIRVSTEDQAAGDGPMHHEERARMYAKLNNWEVCEVYDLAGVSGKTVIEHPETKRMMADVRKGHISTLIFSKLARLARNTQELLKFSDFFRANKSDMVSLQEKIDTSTPAGRLFYTMIAAMAEWEREEIGERVKASVSVRAKLGKPINGSTPYAYKWIDKKLRVVPAEAVILKQIFELFVEHRRKGAVARILNEAGHRTRLGAKWSDTGIARAITCECAKGNYIYNTVRKAAGAWKGETKPEDQWGRLAVEAVVSEDLWHRANQIIEEQGKRPKKVGKTPVRLFAGVAVCHCGQKMYVPTGSRKYTCIKKDCRNKISSEDLEGIFYEELKAYFIAPERIAAHLAKARDGMEERETRLSAHQAEIQKVRDQMARTHQLYLDGQIPLASFGGFHKPLEERLRQLQEEQPRLEAELAHLKITDLSAEEVLHEARQLYGQWPSLPIERKRSVVQSVVEKITVGTDEIELTLSYLPSSEELTNSQQRLTQEGLAELIDLHPSMVKKIEAGRTNMPVTTAMRVRDALGCPWDALLAGMNPGGDSDSEHVGRRLARIAAKSPDVRAILEAAGRALAKTDGGRR